jgi:hypothetical protein
VRGTGHDFDAVGDKRLSHLQRHGEIRGAVIDAWEDMRVQINHPGGSKLLKYAKKCFIASS